MIGLTVKGNIISTKGNFSAAEQLIADYILNNTESVLNMTVQELAMKSKTSAATVSRFARKLSFSSYSELKLQLSSDLSSDAYKNKAYEEIEEHESLYAIKNKLLNNAERSLQETVDQIRAEDVDHLIEALHSMDQIILFGVGASYLAVENISQKWARVGRGCIFSADLNQVLPLVVAKKPAKKLIWLISNSGESPEVLIAARIAKKAGVKIVTTTKMGTNSLTKYADISVQTSQPMESSLRFAATQSLHTQFMLIDIIYYSYVSKYFRESESNVVVSREVINEYKQHLRDGIRS